MLNSFLLAIQFLFLVFSGHKQVALENIALRHQLAVFTDEKKRPRLRRSRSIILDGSEETLDGLEICSDIRSVGDGDRMAAQELQKVLGIVAVERTRTPQSVFGDSQIGPNNSPCMRGAPQMGIGDCHLILSSLKEWPRTKKLRF